MLLKAAVISLGSVSSEMVANAMRAYFKVVDMIDVRDIEVDISGKEANVLYKGVPLENYDCIYAKGSFRYTPVLRALTSILSKKCYMPTRAGTFTVAHDKGLTHLKLQNKGLPMPKTYFTATPEAAKNILKKVSFPIVMKFPSGTQGKGVMFAESAESASSMMDALNALKQPFLVQEYVETGGTDVRVFVVGKKVVASMQRKAAVNEKRANIHAGGSGKKVELDPAVKKVAIEAADAIGAEICGVDILESRKGPLILETNISPGLQGITEVTKIDVAKIIAEYLFNKTAESKKGVDKAVNADIKNTIESAGDIITNLDLRGQKILLPEVITKLTGFSEKDEVVLKAKRKHLEISEFKL